MSPILTGVIASGISGNLTPPDTGAMFPIQSIPVGPAGASSISFTNIPSTYKHLQIRVFARSTRADVQEYMNVRLNSDSGANYSYHYLEGAGSTPISGSATSINQAYSSYITGANANTSVFGMNIIDILDYANTNKNKTFRFLGGFDNNGSGRIALMSDLWMNTNAVTSITFTPSSGNFVEYSQFALYGIKGA